MPGVKVISNEYLQQLATTMPHLLCLGKFTVTKVGHKSCNCPGGKREIRETKVNYEAVKVCLAQCSVQELDVFKRSIDADRVILHLSTPGLPKRIVR
jgi:hypothetical protein